MLSKLAAKRWNETLFLFSDFFYNSYQDKPWHWQCMECVREDYKRKGGIYMLQEQVLLYIRENWITIRMAAAGIGFLLLFVVWIQVTRTRREVHKICKKIRKYFEVILAEDTQEEETVSKETAEEAPLPPVYKTSEEQKQQEDRKKAEDAKLLMDVISEVF